MRSASSLPVPDKPMYEQHHSHERFMLEALMEARAALHAGDIPVGAVIVHDGNVISSGRNRIDSARNDLLHAELSAISKVPEFLWSHRRQCIVYTTLEPCSMCLGTIVYSAIDRIVWGASDPLCATHATIECTPYYNRRRLQLVGGVLEPECQALLNEYVRRDPRRPYLRKS
ncbi:MAG: nucleoside deaminase [Burkholderiales bacterium]